MGEREVGGSRYWLLLRLLIHAGREKEIAFMGWIGWERIEEFLNGFDGAIDAYPVKKSSHLKEGGR